MDVDHRAARQTHTPDTDHRCVLTLPSQLHHFDELNQEARSVVGRSKDEFMMYIKKTFPRLLLHVWRAVFELRTEPAWKKFYTSSSGSLQDFLFRFVFF